MYEIIAGIIFAVVLSALVIEKRSKQDKNNDEKLSLSEIESNIETHNDESQTQDENHNSGGKNEKSRYKSGRKYQRAGRVYFHVHAIKYWPKNFHRGDSEIDTQKNFRLLYD